MEINNYIKEIKLKPKVLKGWYYIKETEKCYVLSKKENPKFKDLYYLPKKDVLEINLVHKNKNGM